MAILNNDKHCIGDLFNNRNPFVIPKHQRAYSWEEEEIESFCEDIKDVKEEYFFGGIVSVHEHASNTAGRIYRVVDGQQRLATFTILLSILKETFASLSEEAKKTGNKSIEDTAKILADDLYENYLTYRSTKGNIGKTPPPRKNRLTLSKVDANHFEQLLIGKMNSPTAESHYRLNQARIMISKKLIEPILNHATLTIEEKVEELQKLKDKLLENSVVIHITCDDLDEAYQLFEVLNDRGKELAIGDYLRSSTLEQLDSNPILQEKASDDWDQILSKKNSEKYIKAYLTSHIAVIKKSNVHRQFQKTFFLSSLSDTQIKNRISNIKERFEVYELLTKGDYPYIGSQVIQWEQKRLSLLVNYLEHKLCIPFLMTIYECATEQEFKEVVLSLEKFVFRYITISGLRANRLSDVYKKHISSMRRGNPFDILDFKQELKTIISTQCADQFFAEKLQISLTYKKNTKTIKKIRYFLTTLEAYYPWFQNKKNVCPTPIMNLHYDLDLTEIEHVYPQNPKNPDKTLERYKNELGNLVFWSPGDNKAASNKDFNSKKSNYSGSNVCLTRDLISYSDWNETNLKNRQNLYCDMAIQIFNI
ncbi:DUF262 domain-containing HNH endonuclease family protein [Paenibacillus campi]|uniref:DUF262 domain-containing protein n=1 Tax=Paenibacillus campi TaxID=3106031 RepID=UPI002B00036A|nr:DUF262 domain-containing HNH endonuclease family protein [Paenibacillus sp. SGZ-1009]